MAETKTTAARGYGWQHQAERQRWQRILNRDGFFLCTRCGQPIHTGQPWDLGHNDQRTQWTGPEHVSCNRAAGGRNSRRRQHVTRDWQ